MIRYKDNPENSAPKDYDEKVLHAELEIKNSFLYFSDSFPNQPVKQGDQVSINIGFDSEEELNRVYDVLKEDADISMALEDTFGGAKFASLVDKYGVAWSMNYQYPLKE